MPAPRYCRPNGLFLTGDGETTTMMRILIRTARLRMRPITAWWQKNGPGKMMKQVLWKTADPGIWKEKHSLYLPGGETWVDAWNTDKEYQGGQTIEVETPLHKIPITLKKGSSLELGDLNALYEQSLEITKQKPDLKALEEKTDFLTK